MQTFVITGYGHPNSLGFQVAKSLKTACECTIIAVAQPDMEIGGKGEQYYNRIIFADLSRPDDWTFINDTIHNVCPNIAGLINCAGTNHMDWLENITYSQYRKVMKVNLDAPIFLTTGLMDIMMGGVVLNIASMGARKPFRTSMPYNVSKAALVMATKQMARELTKTHGLTIFAISPNQIKGTGLTLDNEEVICDLRGWTPEQAEAYRKAGAMIEAETEVHVLAEFIAFLLCKKERHVNLSGVELHYGE